jgi:cyclopropane fatty-acyl-phospholipid synthase-like methyltransferase
MTGNQTHSEADAYWERAGELSYAEAMYRCSNVESHVRGRSWQHVIDIADALGVSADGHVLDLGCGDGAFANQMLASRYRAVDGLDKSETAIQRAQAEAREHATYRAVDLVTFNYESLPRYDAAFLIGILHHVRFATPDIVKALAKRTDKMIILEPNGNNLVRKALEFTPTYRAAGEDSFRTKELTAIFAASGWKTVICRRLNLFPNFTPSLLFRLLRPIEPRIEANPFWNALCTVDLYGLALSNPQ